MTFDLLFITAFDLILILAALDDVRRLRISNILPIALALFFVLRLILLGPPPDIWQHIVSFVAVLVVGAALFAMGMLGGGDAKLLASTALWFDLDGLLVLLPAVTILGGLCALLLVILRRMIPVGSAATGNWLALRPRGPIPYAVAISAGAIATVHLTGV